jgi:hypothetical protein
MRVSRWMISYESDWLEASDGRKASLAEAVDPHGHLILLVLVDDAPTQSDGGAMLASLPERPRDHDALPEEDW